MFSLLNNDHYTINIGAEKCMNVGNIGHEISAALVRVPCELLYSRKNLFQIVLIMD